MRIALVTGGNRGIGLATARRLAEDVDHIDHVVIAARSEAAAREAVEELSRDGHSVSSVRLDVSDPESVRAAAAHVDGVHGHLDVLVNNAGVLPEAVHEATEVVDADMFRRTFGTNVIGAVEVLEAFLPLLRRSPAGRIVNISSTMGSLTDQTDPDSPYYGLTVPAYQSSKAALNGITILLAKQLADTSIKVTSVCPGFVQTDLTPMNRSQAPSTAAEAAEVVHRAATLPHDAPSGTFVDASGPVAW